MSMIYLDAAAGNGGNGSMGSPFGTVAEALAVAINGDTLFFAAGDYTGEAIDNQIQSRSLTFTSANANVAPENWAPGSEVLIDRIATLGGLVVNGIHVHATIEGAGFVNGGTWEAIGVGSPGHIVTVTHSILSLDAGSAIVAPQRGFGFNITYGTDDVTIDHVVIGAFEGFDDALLPPRNNYGVYINGSADPSRDITITNVEVVTGRPRVVSLVLDGQIGGPQIDITGNKFENPGTADAAIIVFDNWNATGPFDYTGITGNEVAGGKPALSNQSGETVVFSSADMVTGTAGDDTFIADSGNDTIDGLGGNDTIDMVQAGNSGSSVDLASGGEGSGTAFSAATGIDTLTSIENVRGSSGNDVLFGGGGSNTFFATAGSDQVRGRGGSDTFDASSAMSVVTVNIATSASFTGSTTTLDSIENVKTGSANDLITGSAAANAVDGGAGFDTFTIAGATATVSYASGAFNVVSGVDSDTLTNVEQVKLNGGAGAKIWLVDTSAEFTAALAGAATGDTIYMAAGTYVATAGLTVGAGVTIQGANAGTSGNVMRVTETIISGGLLISADNVVLDGVKVLGGATGFSNAAIYVDADNVTVKNSIVEGNGSATWGFVTPYNGNVANLLIEDNFVTKWEQGGYFNPTTQFSVKDNTFTDNVNHFVGDDWADGTFIDGNTFTGNVGSAIGYGVATATSVDVGAFVGDNTFNGPGRPIGIFLYGNDPLDQDVTGTAENDAITAAGTSGDHTIHGAGGNDTIVGGSGTDTAVFDDATVTITQIADADQYTMGNQAGWQVVGGGDDGTDKLSAIEVVQSGSGRTLLVGNGGFATIQAAVNAAASGDTILVADGAYAEDVSIVTSGITIQSATQGGADIKSITISADDVVLDGVELTGTSVHGGFAAALYVFSGSDNLTVQNASFSGPGDFGILTESVLGLDISDNSFTGYDVGMYLSGGDTSGAVTGNTFTGGAPATTGTGNGVNSETAKVEISGNTFTGVYSGNINLFPYTTMPGGQVDIASYVFDNTFTNGPARPIQIYPTPVNSYFIGSDVAEAFNGDSSGQPGPFTFFGNGGNDVLAGAGLADTLDGGADDDVLYGGGGDDTLRGGTGTDTLYGEGGNDTLDGGDGDDTLEGGIGDDTYDVTEGDTIIELTSGGTDRVRTGVFNLAMSDYSNVEIGELTGSASLNILGSSRSETLYGNSGNNTIDGRQGADIIYGGDGNDILSGFTGADQLFGGNGHDQIDGGSGNDLLNGGIGNDTLVGGLGDDILLGGDGNDLVVGEVGADIMVGGAGNDVYGVDNVNDVVTDDANGGYDVTYSAAFSYQISANVEELVLSGGAFIGYGNGNANVIYGSDITNVLYGGSGSDVLIGGGGADYFLFLSPADTGIDLIRDFNLAQGDKIGIAAGAFGFNSVEAGVNFVTGEATAATAQLIYDTNAGILYFDTDGTGSEVAVALTQLSGAPVLTASQFVLV